VFILTILEIIFHFKGIVYLMDLDLPLGPIGILGGSILIFTISAFFSNIKLKNKYLVLRKAINKTLNLNIIYTIIYLVFCCILFLLEFVIIISN
jgi:hypothetical protein